MPYDPIKKKAAMANWYRRTKAARRLENNRRHLRWYRKNRQKVLLAMKTHYSENKDKIRGYLLKKKYGMTLDVFNAFAGLQDGKCTICWRKRKLVVDHSHSTGKTRGLLCGVCNRALGMFQDDPVVLARAMTYLTAFIETSNMQEVA